MHASLPVIWRMILCASFQSALHSNSFHPLTHSWSHTLWLARTHLLYVWDWLQASSYSCFHNRELKAELKWSLVLFPQEHFLLKPMKKGEEFIIRALKVAVYLARLCDLKSHACWRTSLPRPFSPQMADARQFFTGKLYVPVHILKLPAEELLWSALHQMT